VARCLINARDVSFTSGRKCNVTKSRLLRAEWPKDMLPSTECQSLVASIDSIAHVKSAPCHYSMARPQVADGRTGCGWKDCFHLWGMY
jgi:hypothetical protein